MELLRAFLSIVFFCLGLYLIIDFFRSDYDWLLLLFAIIAFWVAYWTWPSRRRGKREDEHFWLDLIEIVIELPIEILLWIFRLSTRPFKDGDAGIDL